jgi:6-phosphogluconolactonase
MVFDLDDSEKNTALIEQEYNHFVERTDLIILGMGPDGHTASIFPNDSASDEATSTSKAFLTTNAPAHPTQRITCSLDLIRNAENIALLITGTQKLEVLENTALNLPIHKTIQACPNIQIFYSE